MTLFYDEVFVEIDVLMRRGAHINRSNLAQFDYICQHYDDLQRFYARYGCALYQHPDGFFYMTVKDGLIRSRLLPKSCVHLGQFIALKARDPEITRSNGRISISQLIQDIETLVPRETLQAVYAPKRRDSVVDEHIAGEIMRAIKLLGDLCFIRVRNNYIQPLESIHRFAELARHDNQPSADAAMHLEVQRGVVFHAAEVSEDLEETLDDES